MPKRTGLAIALTLCCAVSSSPARASRVEGFGNIATNLSDPEFSSIHTAYEDPEFLDVRKIVQLTPSQVVGVGHKTLDHLGEAQFGRLRTRSYTGGPVPQTSELFSSVASAMEFEDQFTLQNLNPLEFVYLRLDVELSGQMIRGDNTFGNLANARFGIRMADLAITHGHCLTSFEFTWSGEDDFTITSGCEIDGNRFVPYLGEEPRFTPIPDPGPATYSFGARGYLDVPLDGDEFEAFEFGEPFDLLVTNRTQSSCGVEPCFASADFHTARVYNARFVDVFGNVVTGPPLYNFSADR